MSSGRESYDRSIKIVRFRKKLSSMLLLIGWFLNASCQRENWLFGQHNRREFRVTNKNVLPLKDSSYTSNSIMKRIDEIHCSIASGNLIPCSHNMTFNASTKQTVTKN